MEMITISAKTLDEAITKALLELQTTSDHLYYEIAQKESTGFLGLFGGKPCVIRARVMGEEEESKKRAEKEKAERAAKAAEKSERAAKAEAEKAARAAKEKAQKAERAAKAEVEKVRQESHKKDTENKSVKAEGDKTGENKVLEDFAEAVEEKAMDSQMEKSGDKPYRKNFEQREFDKKRYGRKETGRERKSAEPRVEKQEREPKVRQEVKMDEALVQQKAKDFLKQVFGAMGMNVSVETTVNKEEGELQVMMTGDDMGVLIGKRGQTLDSLQYLVSLVVNKETEGYLRVKLDTENYRERRKDTLETLARNISYKVKRTKRPVSLEPMNPYERRIIHSALQNDRYVVTRSEGEDPYRHVVISLKRDSYKRDRYSGKNRDGGSRDGNRDSLRENSHNRQMEKVVEKTEEGFE